MVLPGQTWRGHQSAHPWVVRVFKVGKNFVSVEGVGGATHVRKARKRLALSTFALCYVRVK